jgi:NTE family protein
VFVPVSIDGRLLADGMITDNLPVDVVKEMGADLIIAVDVIPKCVLTKDPENMVEVLERGLDIGVRLFSEPQKAMADIVIEPVVKNMGPFGLNHSSELIEMGRLAAEAALPELKKKLGI